MHSKDHLQAVRAVNTIDMTSKSNTLVIMSDTPLGDMTIQDTETTYSFSTRSKKYSIPKVYIADLIEVTARSIFFLSRKNISINVSPVGRPFRIQCSLKAREEFELLDSSFPFVKLNNGKSYALRIGVNPPSPLVVQITIPGDINITCDIEVDYVSFPFSFLLSGTNKSIQTKLVVRNTIGLGK
jgi:hypothetical protein